MRISAISVAAALLLVSVSTSLMAQRPDDQIDAKSLALTYSLGLTLDKDGKVTATLWDGPAFNAGIVNGATIVAVNGTAYSEKRIADAITAAKDGKDPIQLLIKRGDRYLTVPVEWHGGLRYPWLEKAVPGEAGLDRLLAPRVKGKNG